MGIEKKKILKLEDLYERAYPYYKEFCNITEKTPARRKEKWEQVSNEIWKQIEMEEAVILCAEVTKKDLETKILTSEWIDLHLGEWDALEGGILYLILLQDTVIEAKSVLEKFYYEMWYGAVFMAAKDVNFYQLKDESLGNFQLSESFAPGFDEIGCEKMIDWLEMLDHEKKYCRINKDLVMKPSNSLLGLYIWHH